MAQLFRFFSIVVSALFLSSCGMIGHQMNRLGGGVQKLIPGRVIRVESDLEKADFESAEFPGDPTAKA